MNIGLFNSAKSWGGGEKWYFDIAVYLAAKNHVVHFYLTRGSELHKRLKSKPVHLHFINVGPLSFLNPFIVGRLAALFRTHHLKNLMIILSSDLKVAGKAATDSAIDKVIYTRAVPIPIKNTALNRYIFSHWATHILVNSKATQSAVLQNNPDLISSNKISLIYNPVNTAEFSDRPFDPIYKAKGRELVIGSIGRLEREKNHQFLIHLSAVLKRRGIVHKILIGGAGSLEKYLKVLSAEKGVVDTVEFVGFQSNVKDLLMSCSVFFLPSLFEGFGFAIAEASLCKLPVIAFNTTSIPELVMNGETGFVIKMNSLEEAVEKIELLYHNPALSQKMGERGFEWIVNHFDEKIVMRQLESFLQLD